MIRNILSLPSYNVIDIDDDEHDYHIRAESNHPTSYCPHCHNTKLIGFGRREHLANDLPMHGKRVGIYINARRAKCQSCNQTFTEKLPDVDENRKMTKRLVKWIGEQSIGRTFSSVANEVRVVEGTVRNIFRDYINQLEKDVRFETPKWMGIDEIHIIKKPRCIISNIEHRTAVEVLINRNKRTILDYFQKLPGRDKVQYVSMDMWRPYKDAVQLLMPDATIVVDKFHVVRMANVALEVVRKEQRSQLDAKQRRGLMHDRFVLLKRRHDLDQKESFKLDGWSANYPTLGAAYNAKEAFYGIWDLDTRTDAENAYQIWKNGLPKEIVPAYGDLIRAIDNWHDHVFTYFDHRITNAYTESLNNLVRVMKRLGRGYSFEALRAKILFTEGSYRTTTIKPVLRKRRRVPKNAAVFEKSMMMDHSMFDFPSTTQEEEKTVNYGADITTLIEIFEKELLQLLTTTYYEYP